MGGHNIASFITDAMLAFFLVLMVLFIGGIMFSHKPYEGERKHGFYLIAAAVVCFIIGWLLPE